MRAGDLPGIDPDGLRAWFATELAVDAPLAYTPVGGGQSNLTYRVDEQGGRHRCWALRRPPVGELRPTAHDVVREWRVITGLAGTPVPVAPAAGVCRDPGVTGAPFYLMDFVGGVVLDGDRAADELDPAARAAFVEACVRTLVAVHEVPPEVAGVGPRPGAGPRPPHLERQLRRWRAQVLDAGPVPEGLLEVHDLLAARAPEETATGLVHGDYRPGNLIVTPDGEVAAVVDWELCSAGDVLVDVGWLVAWWRGRDFDAWAPEGLPGFADADAVATRYAELTGRDVAGLAYYEAFALWRLACIAHGVHLRYAGGQMGDPAQPLEALRRRPARLVELARDRLT
ncbi:phosphotransferase family protein [Nocardioides dongxiaopingii]|uniref:phosphotransferase family protein n=1 Tax=Nocardioides dongxiaopingii TaxID=2576036 RepID=UPI0010C76AF5|nr:phosphotransferase family protein [Nocardioides dongxiaopingii]